MSMNFKIYFIRVSARSVTSVILISKINVKLENKHQYPNLWPLDLHAKSLPWQQLQQKVKRFWKKLNIISYNWWYIDKISIRQVLKYRKQYFRIHINLLNPCTHSGNFPYSYLSTLDRLNQFPFFFGLKIKHLSA